MKVLITGISGYIGSHLAKDCLERGWEVHGAILKGSSMELLKQNGVFGKAHLHTIVEGVHCLRKMIRSSKPDIVFHLATLYIAEHKPEQVIPLVEANVLFGTELLEAMRMEGVKGIVVAETTWQYNPRGEVAPVNLYAATKEAFAVISQYYCKAHGFRTVKIKLFDTYGGHDNRPKLLNKLREISRSGQLLELSKGEQILDFTHIDDITEAFCLGAQRVLRLRDGKSEEYVISGDRMSMKDWIKKIGLVLGRPLPVLFGAKPYRSMEVMVPWSGGKKIKGWRRRVTVNKGLRMFFKEKAGV